jgi:hypothetical protein
MISLYNRTKKEEKEMPVVADDRNPLVLDNGRD